MSFFGQGYPYHHPAAHGYPGRRGHYQSTPHYVHPSPPTYHDDYYGPYSRSPYSYPDNDLEAEEQAAVAHLRAIQRRREAASAHLAREAELRAEREIAFQAALRREREARERAVERERERQRVIKEERERAIKRQQEIARAEAYQALKARAIQAAKAKAYAFAQAQAQQVARQAAFAAQEKKRRYIQAVQAEQARRRIACAGRCGRPAEKKEENKEEDGLKVINDLLGGLFGINIVADVNPAPAPAAKSAPVATEKTESTATPEFKVDAQPAKESKSTEPKAPAQDDTPAFPTEINDLLSHFLGLRVDPATGNESPAQPNKDIIKGLNNFLGQWGLEFEPSPAEEAPKASGSASTSTAPQSSTSKPAEVADIEAESKSTPTPIANFLNGHYDIPPFVRDILSNVEVALTQGQDFTPEPEVKGKGKGVAEGEKTVRPAVPEVAVESATPAESVDTTSSTDSIAKLETISHELFLATESFEFPSKLAFAHPSETTELVPSLLFNKTNSGYHAQAHKLLQLLLAADGISSQGDKDVRQKRKQVVRAVEGAIEALEKKRDAMWEEVKVMREAGEETEDESTSSGASATSDIEHVEHAELYETIPESTATGYKVDDKPQEAGEVVFDANDNTEAEVASAVDDNEATQEAKAEEKVATAEAPVEAEEVETETKVEAEKDGEIKVTGTSTPRSVTVEDQEEGYEVL